MFASPVFWPIRAFGALVRLAMRGPIADAVRDFGRFTRFAYWAIRGVPAVQTWSRGARLRSQMYFVGTTSVPVLIITGSFIGMILAIEGYLQFAAIGQEGRLGGVINISLTKQIGPVLAAVMLAGRVGCSLTAELGTMRVTEQLDAMRAMAADPIRVLVIPRVLACTAMIPILTVVSNLCGVMGGWFIVTRYFHSDATTYWRYTAEFVAWTDLANGLVKSVVFGLMIGLIACYKGFHCKPGAEGVGRATTDSFVTSFIAIIISNLFLAKVLNDLDLIYHGGLMRKIFS